MCPLWVEEVMDQEAESDLDICCEEDDQSHYLDANPYVSTSKSQGAKREELATRLVFQAKVIIRSVDLLVDIKSEPECDGSKNQSDERLDSPVNLDPS